MTQCRYQLATVGFCPDLTDPDARSVPVATVLLGRWGGLNIGAIASAKLDLSPLDEWTREMLEDVPLLLKQHLSEAVGKENSPESVEEALRRLHHSLRNSLHVVEIEPAGLVEVATFADLGSHLARLMLDKLGIQLQIPPAIHDLTKAGRPSDPSTSTVVAPGERRRAAAPKLKVVPDLPSFAFFPLYAPAGG